MALAARAAVSAVLRGRAWEEGGAPPAWPWREVIRTLRAMVAWDHAPDRFAVFEQVATALHEAAAARPLLVLLDDLHAADDDTLALTRYVAASIREAPVAVAGANCEGDANGLAQEIQGYCHPGAVIRVERSDTHGEHAQAW
jgi:hypothetical protein